MRFCNSIKLETLLSKTKETYKRSRKPCRSEQNLRFQLVMRVGIVGAGISGVVAGAHLKAAGIDITVFERSAQAGGIW